MILSARLLSFATINGAKIFLMMSVARAKDLFSVGYWDESIGNRRGRLYWVALGG